MKKGFTLIEVTVVIAIMAITAAIGTPSFISFRERIEVRNNASRLLQLLEYARVRAITSSQRVTICPLDPSNKCGHSWNSVLSVFIDHNNNRVRDTDDDLLATVAAETSGHALRAFNSSVISFDDRGFAGFNTGSFSYCLTGASTSGVVYVISRNGRIREGRDTDGDGLPETPNGKNIPCE